MPIRADVQGNFEKSSLKKAQAQGTIEYLVILAVIVVIALIVVSLMTSATPSDQVSTSTGKISQTVGSGSISVLEAAVDMEGEGIIKMMNISGENMTVKKVAPLTPSGEEEDPSAFNETIGTGGNTTILLADLDLSCPCTETGTTRTCSFNITFEDPRGRETTETITIVAACQEDIEPSDPGSVAGLGEGTVESPWSANSCLELQGMNEDLSAHYVLGGDVDCSGSNSWNDGNGFMPVGGAGGFSGSLDGAGFSVTGIYIERPSDTNTGLFSFLNPSAEVTDISIEEAEIIGKRHVGIIAGQNLGTIEKAGTSGTVFLTVDETAGAKCFGGITGTNHGTISRSSSTASVTGKEHVGGITGLNYGTVSDCSVDAELTGIIYCTPNEDYTNSGGITGTNNGTVLNSFTEGGITEIYRFAGMSCYTVGEVFRKGGVIGINSGDINNSFSVMSVVSAGAAGVIGWNNSPMEKVNNIHYYNNQFNCCGVAVNIWPPTYSCDPDCPEASAESDFHSKSHAVYNGNPSWNFNNVWDKNPGELPYLR